LIIMFISFALHLRNARRLARLLSAALTFLNPVTLGSWFLALQSVASTPAACPPNGAVRVRVASDDQTIRASERQRARTHGRLQGNTCMEAPGSSLHGVGSRGRVHRPLVRQPSVITSHKYLPPPASLAGQVASATDRVGAEEFSGVRDYLSECPADAPSRSKSLNSPCARTRYSSAVRW
jgi:hypothetical protein